MMLLGVILIAQDDVSHVGNISHGLLVPRQMMLRPSLPRRKEASRGR